jgi:hypothetical protein
MRSADMFAAGAVVGAVMVWVWGKEIEGFVGDKIRGARTQAADAIGAVEDTVRAEAKS